MCNECSKSFVIDYRRKKIYWIDYIDGFSFRNMSDRKNKTHKQIFNLTQKELNNLIENTFLTNEYCDPKKYSGILQIDGKYIKVKGYSKKIPFIYAVDYLTHDIVCGILAPSENQEAFLKLFRLLKTINYPLKTIVSDNILETIEYPLNYHFLGVKVQLCLTHYVENIRRVLETRSKDKYVDILDQIKLFLRIREPYSIKRKKFKELFSFCSPDDYLLQEVLKRIFKDRVFLFHYLRDKNIPRDNNLIEVFNSHLEGRLKTIKGFSSFKQAEQFLNAWMVRRRTIDFKSCCKKFNYLNGKKSLGLVLKDDFSLKKVLKIIYKN